MLIINCTSGKDVGILGLDTLNSETVGPITWFNPPKSGLQGPLWYCVC